MTVIVCLLYGMSVYDECDAEVAKTKKDTRMNAMNGMRRFG